MDLGLKSKRALVMSSSRGIGLGIAQALAAEGADILMTARDGTRLEQEAAAINALGNGKAHWVTSDLSDPDMPAEIVAQAEKLLGGIDILINNTGGPPPGKMSEADIGVLHQHFQMMVLRVMDITARVVPGMRERRWGRVLTVASSGVVQPIPNLGLSNAIRSSLVGWSKSMANDLGADGITFNMILPGRIETDRLRELDEANSKRSGRPVDEVRATAISQIPAGRYGHVEEFAAVAAFLASERASYVNGSMVRCDGGAIKNV